MKKSRFTEEQIIGFLKQARAGVPIKELCRNAGFSDPTFYNSKRCHGTAGSISPVEFERRHFQRLKGV